MAILTEYGGPVLDNHFHVQPHGQFLEAVRQFHRHGGTHVTLIPIPGRERKTTRSAWREFFQTHLAHADRIEAETPVRVIRAVGPYPIEFVHDAQARSVPEATAAFQRGYEAAAQLIREGRAVALGEVGRAHFDVPAPVQTALNELLEAGLALARDADCATILHTEHATTEVFADLAARARRAGFPLERLIKHYAPPLIRPEDNHGLLPSLIASRSNVAAALEQGNRFLLETDYIDEPTRPNVVLPPFAVPKRTKALAAQGIPESTLDAIHRAHPERVFRITMEAGRPVR